MRYFILKKLYKLSDKEILLMRARRKFSNVSKELVSRKLDDRDIWVAFGSYSKYLSQAEKESDFEALKKVIGSDHTLYAYIVGVRENNLRGFENRMNQSVDEIKDQNKELKEQNKELMKELHGEGNKSTFLTLTVFVLSTVVAVGLYHMSKESPPKNPVTMDYPRTLIIENPQFNIYNLYLNDPHKTNDGKNAPQRRGNEEMKAILSKRQEIPAPKFAP